MTAMRHEQPDRVPLFYRDVPEVRERLLRDLGCADDDALFERLGIDFRWVQPAYVGSALEDEEAGIRRDIWGVEYRYVTFDDANGYWEPLCNPMKEWTDPAQLEDWDWPTVDRFDFSTLADQVQRYSEFAIMTAPSYASPGIFQCPVQGLIGEEQSFMMPLMAPEFFAALVQKVLEFELPSSTACARRRSCRAHAALTSSVSVMISGRSSRS